MLVDNFIYLYFIPLLYIGGVRGGMSDGKNLKKKLISLTYTPPNLPYPRGGDRFCFLFPS